MSLCFSPAGVAISWLWFEGTKEYDKLRFPTTVYLQKPQKAFCEALWVVYQGYCRQIIFLFLFFFLFATIHTETFCVCEGGDFGGVKSVIQSIQKYLWHEGGDSIFCCTTYGFKVVLLWIIQRGVFHSFIHTKVTFWATSKWIQSLSLKKTRPSGLTC